MASKAKQNAKSKSKLPRIAVLLFLCFVCYTIVKLQVGISQMRTRLDSLEKENAEISIHIEEQKLTLEEGVTQEKIEQLARDQLNYVYPDEIIYTDLP